MTSLNRQDLFLKISKNLVENELKDLRNYVSGGDILAGGFVQNANAHGIFNQMEKENKLKLGDLSLLANILEKIGRHHYAELARQVAADEQKVLSTKSGSSPKKGTKSQKPSCSSVEDTPDGRDTKGESESGTSFSEVASAAVAAAFLGAGLYTAARAVRAGGDVGNNECSGKRKLSSGSEETGPKPTKKKKSSDDE
ncbi:uncharacterized protein LOC144902174 [Branchiostoma floridae x Branchiostoma belcheri]